MNPTALQGAATPSPVALAKELSEFWINWLRPKSWAERLELLIEVHEQIREDIGDFETFCEVSPVFISRIIEMIGVSPIDNVEQAHIYSNSADKAHRDAAGAWLANHHASLPGKPKS